MHNYRVRRVDPESLAVNQRIVQSHMDDEHYTRWIYPKDMEVDEVTSGVGPPTLVDQALVDHWWSLPDVGSPTLLWKLAVPGHWKNGKIRTTLFYSAGSPTGNFSTTWRGYRIKDGLNVATIATGLSVANLGLIPPAAAGDYKSATHTGLLPITQEFYGTTWALTRNTPDANTGTLRILAVRHRYVPAQHMAGGKAVP